jgi:hypothetical protein
MICKEKFVKYANALRKHFSWLNKLYDLGVNIDSEPLAIIEDAIYDVILEGNMGYDYDDYGGVSWVAYWCSSELEQTGFRRVRDWIYIEDAEKLYDFVKEMAELGWPEKVDKEWLI